MQVFFLKGLFSPTFFGIIVQHEVIEFICMSAVLLVAAVRNHNVALEIGVGDF